jgi:hypothetical protein
MGMEAYELASDAQRVESDGRQFVVRYWLVREQMADGAETHFVRCWRQELRRGRWIGGEVEVAGLGADPGTARQIYDRLVAGGASPVHLQDVVRDARDDYTASCLAGRRRPHEGPEAPEPPRPEGLA